MNSLIMPFSGSCVMAIEQQAGTPVVTRINAAGQAITEAQQLDEHMRRMYRLIYRIVGNVADAQDLTQEALIKALRRQTQLKDDRKAKQWLNRIAVNTALDFIRRRTRITFEEIVTEPVHAGASAEQEISRSETRSWIEEGLKLLSDRERTALVLRDVEEMPAAEVAQVMGCSKATVRSHIANARVKFKEYAKKRKK